MTPVFLVMLLFSQVPVDEGTLVIHEDTVEMAHETFRIAAVRYSASESGWRISARTRYDRLRPVVVLSPTLDIDSDSEPLSLNFEVANPRDPMRIRGERTRGRLTMRYLAPRAERAREFPVIQPMVILDDSVFAFYAAAAWRAGPRPVDVAVVVPRAGRREVVTVEDLGTAPTTVNGVAVTLRHVRLTGGANQIVHIWLENGRLTRIEIPSRHLRVERLPPA